MSGDPQQETFGFAEARDVPPRVDPIALGGSRVTVGTCGYSYKDWVGPFYPERTKSSAMLGYYAQRFAAVEVDASYYRVPSEATFASMDARTPPDFRFAVKLPGSVTHLPVEEGGRVPGDAALFRGNLRPLVASGKLAAVLMQFPHAFKPTPRAEAYLATLREEFSELPLVAEFRNREWQRGATLELLASLGIAWCNVDEPQFETMLRPSSDVVGPLGYLRLHGRNYKNWWRGSAETRYDYDYTPQELAPWTERVAEMAAQTEQTYVFFNNHRLGRAASNAGTFARMLLEGIEA
ncbi:MAG TPA: DUF72 domain-containing protein [Candidatus Baltobacteraceae bacterium]|nr:DUF72 domain-containing protein [Candidatus Baltobacteraceae bacterium]